MATKKVREEVFIEEEEEVLGGGAAAAGAGAGSARMPFPQYMAMMKKQRNGWRIVGYILVTVLLLSLLSPLAFGILGIFSGGALGALLGLSILFLAIWKLVDLARS
jgi:hypothetical protein